MKRIVIAISIIALSIFGMSNTAKAQDTGWYAGVHGGLIYSGNENSKYGEFAELINGTALFSVGYDFNELWGIRFMGGYGANTSACNVKEHAGRPIDYYTLKDASGFIDGTLNLTYLLSKRTDTAVVMKGYAGIGSAYAWAYEDFTESAYLDYNAFLADAEQFALGFRIGGNIEYRVSNRIGALIDANVTAFQDNFNGVQHDFALDLRASLTFGLVYHF